MKFAKKLAVAALAATAAFAAAEVRGVVLQVDQIKQRYPWNGLVDVDYTIGFGDGEALEVDDCLEVLMVDRAAAPAVTNRAITFLQVPLPLSAGKHRITWDAHADGVTTRTDRAEMHVSLVHYAETYMVIDVSKGSAATVYPVDFLNGAPSNGFNVDEYKTDKIVLRRIHPGSYVAGSPGDEKNRSDTNERQHPVTLSKPFYVGLFEITQKQYLNVTGADPSKYKGDCRPVENMDYNAVRGGNWPTTTAPGTGSFMGKLLAKCKSKDEAGNYTVPVTGFDLPTEFQWEYACRAGTASAFNTTNAYNNADSAAQEVQLRRLGRYENNQSDGRGEISEKHTVVGSYEPNAWGLYDMHGNVYEWCRDWLQTDVEELKQFVDPKGPDSGNSGTKRVIRGGAWNQNVGNCRSAKREPFDPTSKYESVGFRLFRDLP
ncbi:MAG: formylglycine-generating enzyme family protein [Kiritimatiellae bacterium]|nr:formylglycine-generating enzyme family protein [Kiritimatiellia bacterium]